MVPPAPEAQREGQATAGPAPDGEQSAGSPPDRSDPCVSQLQCDVEKCAKRIALCVQRTEVRVVGRGRRLVTDPAHGFSSLWTLPRYDKPV